MLACIRKLPADSALAREEAGDVADWSMLNANLARLLDLMEYWLTSEYSRWVTDPAELRRQQARNQRDGIRPPPFPLIEPVAVRPASVHAEHVAVFEAFREQFSRGRRAATREEFDQARGIETEVQGSNLGRDGW